MCKPCVNQILPCANQKQPCVNCFAPYANPQFSAIPTCFAKPSGHTSYFHVLITCRTFPVQPGEVTFWGQKKFTHFITVLPGLPPDVTPHQVSSGEQCYLLSKSRSCRDSCGPRKMSFHDRSHRRSWLERFYMLALLERMASKTSSRRKRRSCCCHGVCIGFLRPEAQSQETEIEHEIMK